MKKPLIIPNRSRRTNAEQVEERARRLAIRQGEARAHLPLVMVAVGGLVSRVPSKTTAKLRHQVYTLGLGYRNGERYFILATTFGDKSDMLWLNKRPDEWADELRKYGRCAAAAYAPDPVDNE